MHVKPLYIIKGKGESMPIEAKLREIFTHRHAGDKNTYIPSKLFEKRVASHPRKGDGFSTNVVKFWKKKYKGMRELDKYPYEKRVLHEIFTGTDLIYAYRSGTGSGKSSLVRFLASFVKRIYVPQEFETIVSPMMVCDLQNPKKFSCGNRDINDETFETYAAEFYELIARKLEQSIASTLHKNSRSFITSLYHLVYSDEYQLNDDLIEFQCFIEEIGGGGHLTLPILKRQFIQYKNTKTGKEIVDFLFSYLQAKNMYRKENYRSIDTLFTPITIIFDNTDKVHYKLLSRIFEYFDTIQSLDYSQHANVKIVLFARLSTSEDTINSLGDIDWRSFQAPDVIKIITERCILYLLNNKHNYNDSDENAVRSKVLMLLIYLTHPYYRLDETIRAVSGTNIRNAMKFIRDYLLGRHIAFATLNVIQVNSSKRLSRALKYYVDYQFGIYFQRFAEVFNTELSDKLSVTTNVSNIFKINNELLDQIFDPLGDELRKWRARHSDGQKFSQRINGTSAARRKKILDLMHDPQFIKFFKTTPFFAIANDAVIAADAALKRQLKPNDKGRFIELLEKKVIDQAVIDLEWGNTKKDVIKSWLPVWMIALRESEADQTTTIQEPNQQFNKIRDSLVYQLSGADIYQDLENAKISSPGSYSSHIISMKFLRSVQNSISDESPIRLLCLRPGKFCSISCCILSLLSVTSNSSKDSSVAFTIGRVTAFLESLGFTRVEITKSFMQLTRVDNRLILAQVDDSDRIKTELFEPEYAGKYLYLTNAGSSIVKTQFSSTTYFQFQVESLGRDINSLEAFSEISNNKNWQPQDPTNLIDAMNSILDAHSKIKEEWESRVNKLKPNQILEWSAFSKVQSAFLGPIIFYTESRRVLEKIVRGHLRNIELDTSSSASFKKETNQQVHAILARLRYMDMELGKFRKEIVEICRA